MPIYEFSCAKCGRNFEEIVRDNIEVPCPYCGAKETQKLISTCARRSRGDSAGEYAPPSSGGGCGGCSGGNCASCGH